MLSVRVPGRSFAVRPDGPHDQAGFFVSVMPAPCWAEVRTYAPLPAGVAASLLVLASPAGQITPEETPPKPNSASRLGCGQRNCTVCAPSSGVMVGIPEPNTGAALGLLNSRVNEPATSVAVSGVPSWHFTQIGRASCRERE